ncbi:polysaccharide pyruvyl transferase family protein [Burkholderia sp. LA-2-3-30-S1-D2]|uniref:polysaccharide pyruvyl transferase family protein n=1 Tax=Burkholderia sp. LA-2-3-30-S1-D2 TaxID=1637862 RepID=UPI0009EAC702|nr:polysaccharide pyruvyl transferase family protein [Burkholderia sp. LA-2-3-30-S1-D2]
MFKSPVVLGIFSQENISKITLDQAFSNSGKNTGNLLFSESLYQNIQGSTKGHLGFTEADLEDKDCIVLAAANWLNSDIDLGSLYERLRRTKLPIVIVGLGAQSSLRSEIPKLKEGTLNLVRLIAERSSTISTRGDFSASVLEAYGIKKVSVTGCPSLLLAGKQAPAIKNFSREMSNGIVIGGTRHGFQSASLFQIHLYRQALKFNLHQVLQSELADMYFALKRYSNQEILLKATNILGALYGENESRIANYVTEKTHVFFDLTSWLAFMNSKAMYVGTRLHGAIASLLAGTPATLIVHDSRTAEVATALNIPFVNETEIDIRSDIDFSSLYSSSDVSKFINGYNKYRLNFVDFFEKNNLRMLTTV